MDFLPSIGLETLDAEMGINPYLSAFGPIKLITAGGFLAVSYLGSRKTTGDLDYLLDPKWAHDSDIKNPLREAMGRVGERLQFNNDWINEDIALFVTKESREYLFREAQKQQIVLWEGPNLMVLAAPMEWALERKLRRIHAGNRDRKAEFDLQDALAILKFMRDKKGPLDKEYIRRLNVNSFDMTPDNATMDRVAAAYRNEFDEEVFR